MKSEFAPTSRPIAYIFVTVLNMVKQSFSMPFFDIYKREIYVLLAIFGGATMMKQTI